MTHHPFVARTFLVFVCALTSLHAVARAAEPAEIPGLKLWLRADSGVEVQDGKVAAWKDASGNNNDVAQTDAARRPVLVPGGLNGLPIIRFVGDSASAQNLSRGVLDLGNEAAPSLTVISVVQLRKKCFFGTFVSYGEGNDRGSFRMGQYSTYGSLSAGGNDLNLPSPLPSMENAGFKLVESRFDGAKNTFTLWEGGDLTASQEHTYQLKPKMPIIIGGTLRQTNGLDGDIAEVLVYANALTDDQRTDVRRYLLKKWALHRLKARRAAGLQAALYPGLKKLYVSFDQQADEVKKALGDKASTVSVGVTTVPLQVVNVKTNEVAATGSVTLDPAGYGDALLAADLPAGEYSVEYSFRGARIRPAQTFTRTKFVWEDNTLGITDKIYAPFGPLAANGKTIKLTQRDYTMNSLGLFDKVVTEGRDILAAPMTIQVETAGGLQKWTAGGGSFTQAKPNIAVWQSSASTPALKISTKTTTEFDGCARVDMTLAPGAKQQEIQRAWLEIPLKDEEVPLFHAVAFESMRRNYVGATPRGGDIAWGPRPAAWVPPQWSVKPGTEAQSVHTLWTAADTRPWKKVAVNDFVPYVWLGAEERGLAWFGENDKGYIPDNSKPAQVLTRERTPGGERVVLRVYLINRPTTLTDAHTVSFGLQASPTKPMPPNWRDPRNMDGGYQASLNFAFWSAMTVPGAYLCSDKYPLDRDLALGEKILDANRVASKGGKPDLSFLDAKVADMEKRGAWHESYTPQQWLEKWQYLTKYMTADSTYFEEHWTNDRLPDAVSFINEWRGWPQPTAEQWAAGNVGGGQTFTGSYRDFCLYYANEWLKRGLSLYFDNTMPAYTLDPTVNPNCYFLPDGRVQAAMNIWAQRAYYRRIWNLVNEWNEKNPNGSGGKPYRFTTHMTNTLLLPMHEWTTSNLDIEWGWIDYGQSQANADPGAGPGRKADGTPDFDFSPPNGNASPFPPEVLRAETLGRQVGTPSYALGFISPRASNFKNDEKEVRTEWGMRVVHEIPRNWPIYEKRDAVLRSFGYGKPDVEAVNYWMPQKEISVANPIVKWLLLRRAVAPFALMLVQSYSTKDAATTVRIPGATILVDVETREQFAVGDPIPLKGVYGNRVLLAVKSRDELPAALSLCVPAAALAALK